MQAPYSVRLACVKHAASVRSEPGSNSPVEFLNRKIRFQVLASTSCISSTTICLLFSFQRPKLLPAFPLLVAVRRWTILKPYRCVNLFFQSTQLFFPARPALLLPRVASLFLYHRFFTIVNAFIVSFVKYLTSPTSPHGYDYYWRQSALS